MRAARSRVKDKLLESLSKSDGDFPLDLAESAVLDYYMAGTLTGGLQELHEQSSLESKTNQASQKQTIANAETPLAKLEAIEMAFRNSVAGTAGLTPEKLRTTLAPSLQ